MGCCSSHAAAIELTEPTPFIDERNATTLNMVKALKLKHVNAAAFAELNLPNSSVLSSHLAEPSIEHLKSLRLDPTVVSGLVFETNFVPHEPIYGIELQSQFLTHEATRGSPHYMAPGKFDIHVFNLENGSVVEFHGNAHVNPFSEDPRKPSVHAVDRDGSCKNLRWYFYKISAGPPPSQIGPAVDLHCGTAMVDLCVLSHFAKFGYDNATLRQTVLPANVAPLQVSASSSLLANQHTPSVAGGMV